MSRKEDRYLRRQENRNKRKDEINKLYGNYDNIIDTKVLIDSYYKCRYGVGWKESVIQYGANVWYNAAKLHDELANMKYKQKKFVEFNLCERGKLRHIRSIHVSDRVIQKSLSDNCLVPALSNSFIYDNGASLKGKGTDFAINRLTDHLKRFYRKHGTNGYIVLCDYKKFFDSLNHDVIYKMISNTFYDNRILWLVKQMVDPIGDVGLGLGSQVNQILAVAYPNSIDHLVTCKYGIKYYGRYMDDFYFIVENYDIAIKILDAITEASNKTFLSLNINKTKIIPLSQPFVFLKNHIILTTNGKVTKHIDHDNVYRQQRKLKRLSNKLSLNMMTYDEFRSAYTSWRGYALRKDNSFIVDTLDILYNNIILDTWDYNDDDNLYIMNYIY